MTDDVPKIDKARIIRESMPYGKVLVVDDIETNLNIVEGLLKQYKLKIDTVMSGRGALDRIKNAEIYDIIFMDHMMPEMDGIETTKHLRGLGYTAPIIALSANASDEHADTFLQNGFDAYISKPIDVHQLNAVLNKFVRDRQPQEVIEAARMQAEESSGGEEPMKNQLLLESFLRDADKTILLLKELCQKEILKTDEGLHKFTTAVHGIKSSLGNIGEASLSESAFRLEKAGRGRNLIFLDEFAPKFIEELCMLKEKMEQNHNDGDTDEDVPWLCGKLLSLQEICADYNRKDALEILEEIKQKRCSKETREALVYITGYVLHSEFEAAEETIALYLAQLSELEAQESELMQILHYKIDGLDIPKGLEKFDDDIELYLKVLRSYTASIRSLPGLTDPVNKDTLKVYERAVHSIKGTSLDIFAVPAGNKAADLEKAAKAGNFDYIEKETPVFLKYLWNLISGIEDMLSNLDSNKSKQKKDKIDGGLLLDLLKYCGKYDMDGVDAVMEEIEDFQYESDNELSIWLRENVDLVNFAEISKRLSSIEK